MTVNGILDRVSGLAGELELANLQPQIAACRRQFNGSHGIDVAVFGRFKAGKGSFLNSLTGRAVLPIGVVPLTAAVTRLRYGPAEKFNLTFLVLKPIIARSLKLMDRFCPSLCDSQISGNPVRIGDGCATVTGCKLPAPLATSREGGSEVKARSQDIDLAVLVMVPLPGPTSPSREG